MPTLDLMDMTTTPPERLDSATLKDGKIKYEGTLIKGILAYRLRKFSAEEVFKNYTGWSNGYVRLQLKAETEE